MAYKGIDISKWQGNIDFDKVENNVDFIIVRGGYFDTIDPNAEYYLSECNKRNIPVGVYWFSYAERVSEAIAEANLCLELVSKYRIEYPIYYDFESLSFEYIEKRGIKATNELINNLTDSFCRQIENAGYFAGIYANEDFVANKYSTDILSKYALWYANWNGKNKRNAPIWQYSSKGQIDGINGNVDLNLCYINYPLIIKNKNLNNLNTVSYQEIKDALMSICSLIERGEKNGFRP